jgi:Domain of unknown function (DUF222)
MFGALGEILQELQEVVSEIRPELLSADEAERLVKAFSRLENVCAAGKAIAVGGVARSEAWRRHGERSAAHWVAKATGTSVGQAVGTLEAARRLEDLPATREAFAEGRVSETQVSEIAAAARVTPAVEQELLKVASSGDLTGLREQCRKVRAGACDELSRYEAIRRTRYLRHWTDPDGAFRLDGRLTPDAGATVLAALEPHRQRIFTEARRAGRREPLQAYLADALVALAEGASTGKDSGSRGPRAMVHVRVDHSAFIRGYTEEGETCDIPGVGPIPVATARALSSDAILAAVITKGSDVVAVAHMGRTIPARLRTALEARDPECAVPGCHVRHNLQIDHIKPFAEGGPTRLSNLGRLCPWHHYLKTHLHYVLGGGPGEWTWSGPKENGDGAERAPP